MKDWIVRWLMRKEIRAREEKMAYAGTLAAPEEAVHKPSPKIRIGTMDVMNGKLLEVASYKQSNHGPDWKTEYYILEEGRPLAEQIAVVMTMRGMGV
jgi:hypothetical protein